MRIMAIRSMFPTRLLTTGLVVGVLAWMLSGTVHALNPTSKAQTPGATSVWHTDSAGYSEGIRTYRDGSKETTIIAPDGSRATTKQDSMGYVISTTTVDKNGVTTVDTYSKGVRMSNLANR